MLKVPSHTRSPAAEISAAKWPPGHAWMPTKPVELRFARQRGGISTAATNGPAGSAVAGRGAMAAGTGGGEINFTNLTLRRKFSPN